MAAPEIVGKNLYVREMRLSDFRGKTVFLFFGINLKINWKYLQLLADEFKPSLLIFVSFSPST